MSRDKLRVKFLFKIGQEDNEESLIVCVKMYLETWEGSLYLVFLFNMQKRHRGLSKITLIFLRIAFK
jgi:hypothetical protein